MEKQDFKALREAKGYTQEELAELIGTQQPFLANWENGECLPYTDKVVKLCDALDVCVEKLMHSFPRWEKDHGEEWKCRQNCTNCPNVMTMLQSGEEKSPSGEELDINIESVITVLGHIKECLENPEKRVDDFVYDWCRQNPDKPDVEKTVREVYSRDLGYAIRLLTRCD